jgi:hypothetical protein
MAKQAIALTYKVPLPLVTVDATSFNNYTEAKLAFYDDAVIPLFDTIFGELGDWLMPRYDLDPTEVRITYNLEQVTNLVMRRNRELKIRRESNVETVNELRADIAGLDDQDGGDSIYLPATMVPIEQMEDLHDEPEVDPRVIPDPDLEEDPEQIALRELDQ